MFGYVIEAMLSLRRVEEHKRMVLPQRWDVHLICNSHEQV